MWVVPSESGAESKQKECVSRKVLQQFEDSCRLYKLINILNSKNFSLFVFDGFVWVGFSWVFGGVFFGPYFVRAFAHVVQ